MTENASSKRIGSLEILSPNGGVERAVKMNNLPCEVGRKAEGVDFPDDVQMADRQACLRFGDDCDLILLEDLGVGSGVWIRVTGVDGRSLVAGDQLWLGAQILVVRKEEDAWSLDHHDPNGAWCAAYVIPAEGSFVGRAEEVALDENDLQLSRRHAQVVPEEEGLRFYDRGAHNGSFLRVTTPEKVVEGTEFRIGAQRIRYAAPPVPVKASPSEPEPEIVSELVDSIVWARPEGLVAVDTEPRPTAEVFSDSPVQETKSSGGLASRLRRLGRRVAANESASMPAPDDRNESPPTDSVLPPTPPEEAAVVSEVDSAFEERTVISSLPEMGLEAGRAEAESEDGPLGDFGQEKGARIDPVLVVIDSDQGSISLTVEAGKTVLDAVREAGLTRGDPVDWECGDGGCGVCIVGVVEGADRMDPPDAATGEMKTIQITEQVVPDPKLYRLACLARVRGTVRLRKMT